MQAATEFETRPVARSTTPQTDAAKFTITLADVGSPAVRAGLAAQFEEDRDALLVAAKIALARLGAKGDALAEYALKAAIRMAEASR